MQSSGPPTTDRDHALALRQLAEAAARAGGRVAQRFFQTDFVVRLKPDHSEVCEADEQAQAAIVAHLQAARPADAFLAEESLGPLPAVAAAAPVCWVVDPIDGTRNFVRGIPLYAVSVAALVDGWPIAGAIYEPERDTLYSASAVEPLHINGTARAPGCGAPAAGRKTRPMVALPSNPAGPVAAMAHAWLSQYICRNLGSTALHLALVAAGRLDAMLSDNARLWDLAAGAALVGAARAVMTAPDGQPIFPVPVDSYRDQELPVLAASRQLHARLVCR